MISFDLGTMWFETRILSPYPFFTLRCAETCLRFELSFERCREIASDHKVDFAISVWMFLFC